MIQKVTRVILGMLIVVSCFTGIGIKNNSYKLTSYAYTSDWNTHWANKEIQEAMDKGWVVLTDTFRPQDSITRAEFVKIFNRAFELTETSGKVFNDTTGHWAKNEIDIAVTNGVCNGISTTEFRPNDPITREQVAVMIANYNKIADTNLDKLNMYNDKNQVSSWATSSVEGVIEKGYMGAGGIAFNPKNDITRAETVVTISRVVSNAPIAPGQAWPEVISGDVSQNNVSSGQYFTKDGDWLYYSNYSDQSIYKIKTDGTNKTKLVQINSSNMSHIAVKDGYLYYIINGGSDAQIWRMKVDGTEKKQLDPQGGSAQWYDSLNFYKDNIYYNSSWPDIRSSKLDGSLPGSLPCQPTLPIGSIVCGNKIYYTNYRENSYIYEMNLDTDEKTKINNNNSYKINIYNEYLYFLNRNDNYKIYRTKIGGNTEKVSDETTFSMNIDNGWIYYENEKDNKKLYKMKIDGTNKVKLSDDSCGGIHVVGNWIFYMTSGGTEYFMIKNDGSLKYKI